MVIKYKSYCKEIPAEGNLRSCNGSFFNKPEGGLWGCRGDEWKEWCESEEFRLDHLEKVFYFKMKKHSKIYKIKTKRDFLFLLDNFGTSGVLGRPEIDYLKVKEIYDAVEVVGDAIWKLRYEGLYAWDVPSICVLNPEKVTLYLS